MDWPTALRPFLTQFDKDQFECGQSSPHQSRLLRSNTPVFKSSPETVKPESGFHILLSARLHPVQVVPEEISAALNYLPFSAEKWQDITNKFQFHNAICRAMFLERCYSTYLVKERKPEPLEMYTSAMSTEWPDNIAISSTHFQTSRFTATIIFGCNEEQMDRVENLLSDSPEVWEHPLLMVRVFAELQRDRLDELVQEIIERSEDLMINLKIRGTHISEDQTLTWQDSRRLGEHRLRGKRLEEEVRTTREELKKMVQAIKHREKEDTPGGVPTVQPDFTVSTRRFVNRFEEICGEMDSLMAKCRISYEEVTFAREIFINELARREAAEARKAGSVSTVIAFVAMLYLPMTSVATVFAMPVFNFGNHWVDARWNLTSSQSSSSGGAGSGGSDSPPVFSGYFWTYLAATITLTLITILGWSWYTKEPTRTAASGGIAAVAARNEKSGGWGASGYPGSTDSGGGTMTGANGSVGSKIPLLRQYFHRLWPAGRKWSWNPWSWFGTRRVDRDISKA
ncbi:hypothetical protein B0T26DRAFT_751839 [Lasiosphaeria miniovina]|uniref:Uncharacterized protein n=1 Tax=Lasiosphaeria miniovina TaxID=1954250 RepID=A0AA40AL18_9PEZI|nr:uncharacterized protein B0T26DRAFT_751839 [Lasiosphaeria miniovina]KAK0717826.1 hypothetical protein B0T26DRAFT_751839 [Lasiosphaeria miniovina]